MQFQTLNLSFSCLIIAFICTESCTADELGAELKEVDRLRAGFDTPFDKVDKRCEELLQVYTAPEEKARVFYMWAHIESQSGLQHPEKTIGIIEKALALPQGDEERLQLLMYLGNNMEVQNRGVTNGALRAVRPTIVETYLKAINECVKYIAEAKSVNLPPLPQLDSQARPDNKKLAARGHAQAQRDQKIERLVAFQIAFEKQVAYLYSRMPFATEEITKLAEKHIPDDQARLSLMRRIRKAVREREEKYEGEKLRASIPAATGDKSGWSILVSINLVALIVIGGIIVWRRRSPSQ